jgi:hypothetical protein
VHLHAPRSSRWSALFAALLSIPLTAACGLRSGYDPLGEPCGTQPPCDQGLVCQDGVCISDGSPDGSVGGADADPNAPDADPSAPDAGPVPDGGQVAPSLGTPGCGSTLLLRDSFDDTTMDPQWSAFTTSGATISETSGRLTVHLNAGSADADAGYSSATIYDLAGAEMSVKVLQGGGQYTTFELDGANGRGIGFQLTGTVLRVIEIDSEVPTTIASTVYDSTAHRYWRIREADGSAIWETSADGSSWSLFYLEPWPLASTRGYVTLLAGGQLSTVSEAWFDDLNVPGRAAPGICPASIFSDTFDGSLSFDWTAWVGSGDCSGGISNGTYTLSFSGNGDAWCGVQRRQFVDLRDSAFAVEVPTSPTLNRFESFIEAVTLDHVNEVEMRHEPDGLYMEMFLNGVLKSSTIIPFSATNHRFWRIRESSGTTYWDTSADGATWTNRASAPTVVDLSAVILDLAGGHWTPGPGSPATVRFDNFGLP